MYAFLKNNDQIKYQILEKDYENKISQKDNGNKPLQVFQELFRIRYLSILMKKNRRKKKKQQQLTFYTLRHRLLFYKYSENSNSHKRRETCASHLKPNKYNTNQRLKRHYF